MNTWHSILSTMYPELVDIAHRMSAKQSVPWGNRAALAEDALHDACESLLCTASVPALVRDCRSYAITVLNRAVWRAVARMRSVLTEGLDEMTDNVPAPRARAWDAMICDDALQVARAAAGDRLWPFLAARVANPEVSAGEVAQSLGTSAGMVRLNWHEARQRVARARDEQVA